MFKINPHLPLQISGPWEGQLNKISFDSYYIPCLSKYLTWKILFYYNNPGYNSINFGKLLMTEGDWGCTIG